MANCDQIDFQPSRESPSVETGREFSPNDSLRCNKVFKTSNDRSCNNSSCTWNRTADLNSVSARVDVHQVSKPAMDSGKSVGCENTVKTAINQVHKPPMDSGESVGCENTSKTGISQVPKPPMDSEKSVGCENTLKTGINQVPKPKMDSGKSVECDSTVKTAINQVPKPPMDSGKSVGCEYTLKTANPNVTDVERNVDCQISDLKSIESQKVDKELRRNSEGAETMTSRKVKVTQYKNGKAIKSFPGMGKKGVSKVLDNDKFKKSATYEVLPISTQPNSSYRVSPRTYSCSNANTSTVSSKQIISSVSDGNITLNKRNSRRNKQSRLETQRSDSHSKGLIPPFLDKPMALLKKPSALKWSTSFSDRKPTKGEDLIAAAIDKTKESTAKFIPRRRRRAQIRPRYANFLHTCHHSLIRSQSMEEVVKKLSEGAFLWKIRGINKYYNRQYKVDQDSMSLVAESKKWWSPGGISAVPILDIAEIREGWKTDTFNKVSDYNEKMKEKGTPVNSEPVIDADLCFSIIHGSGGREVLDLMANSKEQRDLWINGLKFLLETVQSLHEDRLYDVWLRRKFEAADKDNNKSLNLDEVCKLVTSLNLKLDKKHARSLFNEANKNHLKRDGEQVLDAHEFVTFYHLLLKMPEIENLYARYVNRESNVMGVDELLSFLKTENGLTNFQTNQAMELIQQFEASNLKEKNHLSFDGFYHLLLSDFFDIFNNEHQQRIYQDMTQPLAHYYISSSHNTYLIGHQLAGESSVEGYISALKRGCRVVELDLWDGDEGEPIIYHGHTLTSKITLADVLKDAIKLYAFTASPYPVILSIENHLCIEQQVVMVRLLKEILGESLLTDPVPSNLNVLPSPEDLKYKIIVKAKKPQGVDIEEDDEEDDPDTIDYIDSDDGNSAGKRFEFRRFFSFARTLSRDSQPKPHKPMAPELAQVVNVCEGRKFLSFASSFETETCIHFPSLRENKAKSLFESSPEDFVKFTSRQIAKIYPLGTRTDSSNLKPYPFWSVGAQVVTLNMQTEDKANFYNEALFRQNGNCGYVLKPDILLGKSGYNPRNPSPSLTKVLRVKMISGQHLPPSEKKNDVVDPYIQLKVRGHPDDKQKQRTKIVKNNGFNPVWNEVLEVKIKVPEVALIYFTVRDESSLAKDQVLALACIPFASLCTGYRHVHLTDITGKSISPAALFVHVAVSKN